MAKLDTGAIPSYTIYFALSLVLLTILLIAPVLAILDIHPTEFLQDIHTFVDPRVIVTFIITIIIICYLKKDKIRGKLHIPFYILSYLLPSLFITYSIHSILEYVFILFILF